MLYTIYYILYMLYMTIGCSFGAPCPNSESHDSDSKVGSPPLCADSSVTTSAGPGSPVRLPGKCYWRKPMDGQ